MKKNWKRGLSLLLTLAMVFSLAMAPAGAAGEPIDPETADVAFGFANWSQTGTTATLDVTISVKDSATQVGMVQADVAFPRDMLTLTGVEGGNAISGLTLTELTEAGITASNVVDGSGNGNVTLLYYDGSQQNHAVTSGGVIGKLTFTVDTTKETDLEGFDFTQTLAAKYNESTDTSEEYTTAKRGQDFWVKGTPPTIGAVTLTESGAITVNGTDAPISISANATSTSSKSLDNDMVTWGVDYSGVANGRAEDVTIDEIGTITVSAKARAGAYKITAKEKAGETTGSAEATLTVNRADSVIKSMTLDKDSVQVDGTNGGTVTVTVTDQYDEGFALTDLTTDSTDTAIKVDKDAKTITVGPKAQADDQITVTAKDLANNTKTAEFAVTRAAAVVDTVTITTDSTELTLPVVGSSPATAVFTVTATDQYGDSYTPQATTWSATVNGQQKTGIYMEDATLKVSNEAKDTVTATSTVSIAVTATADGKTSEPVTVNVARAASVATTVEIYKDKVKIPAADTVIIPQGDTPNTYTYTAKLLDQYGAEMTDTFTWACTAASGGGAGLTVTDGTVSVPAGTAKDSAYILTATSTNGSKSTSITLTAKDIEITWPTVSVDESKLVYGHKWSEIITLDDDGSAKVGSENITGAFSVKDGDTLPEVGDKQYTLNFTSEDGVYNVDESRNSDKAIAPKPISDDSVTVEDIAAVTYDKTAHQPTVTVKDGETALTANTDYTVAYTDNTNAGTGKVTITGTGNYTGSREVTFAINKADITGITTTVSNETFLANDPKNANLDAVKGSVTLPGTVAVTFGDSGTEQLGMTWAWDKTVHAPKGGAYTATGTVTPGDNFNATDQKLTVTVTVNGVNITSITGMEESVQKSKSQVTAAADLAAVGLPANVTLKFDGGVADQSVAAQYDTTLAEIKAAAEKVNENSDQKLDVKLTDQNFPAWATWAADILPKTTISITNKYPIQANEITFNDMTITYGEKPAPAASVDVTGNYAGVTYTYVYEDKDGKVVDPAAKDLDVGSYVVTVTVENANYKGIKTAQLTVREKTLTDANVTLPAGPYTYNKQPHTPEPTVKDGEKSLVKGADYTVEYADNTAAGTDTAKVKITGQGNYTGAVTKTFTIGKAPIAALKPAISGKAEAGSVLTASLPGVADSEVTWSWKVGEAVQNVTANTYEVQTADSNKDVTVTAVAAERNYTGSSAASDAVKVAKVEISGTVTVTETDGGGTAGKIEVGDTLTASAALVPAVAPAYQWYNNGAAIENETGPSYVVKQGDEKLTVKVKPSDTNYGGEVTSTAVEVGKTVLIGTVAITAPASPAVGATLTADLTGITNNPAPADTDYAISWLRDGTVISGAAEADYVITEDDLGKNITVKVTAKNTFTGELVSSEVSIPAAAPAKPVVTASAGNGQVTLTWAAPADHGSPILKYTVTVTGETPVDVTPDKLSYTVTGLENGTEYTFTVTAVNAVGGTESEPVKASPRAPSHSSGGGSYTPATPAETETKADGTTVSTSTGKDGTVQETITRPDGTKATVTTKPDGSAVATVTTKEGAKAAVTTTKDGDTTAKVTIPAKVDSAKVTIPAKTVTAGTVPVLVKPDGTEEVIKMSAVDDIGVVAKMTGSGEIKLVDKSVRFVDTQYHWAQDSVDFVSARALFKGTTDTTFTPDSDMTRGMLVTVLYRLDGEHKGDVEASFKDVEKDFWYTDAVDWGTATGVVNGMGDGIFAPNRAITREQLCAMLYRYAGQLGLETAATGDVSTFTDSGKISGWAREAISWAMSLGLVQGRGGNVLAPEATATRAEVATILERFVKAAMK